MTRVVWCFKKKRVQKLKNHKKIVKKFNCKNFKKLGDNCKIHVVKYKCAVSSNRAMLQLFKKKKKKKG